MAKKRITPAFIRNIEQNRKRMTIASICEKHGISLTQYYQNVRPYITPVCPQLTKKKIKEINADIAFMNLAKLRQKHKITTHQYNKYIKSPTRKPHVHKCKPLTTTTIKKILLDINDLNIGEILDKYDISMNQYQRNIAPLFLKKKKPPKNQERDKIIISLYKAGVSLRNIGKKFHLSFQRIEQMVYDYKAQHQKSMEESKKNKKIVRISKILKNQKLLDDIKKEWEKGTLVKSINLKFHIYTTEWNIVRKHLNLERRNNKQKKIDPQTVMDMKNSGMTNKEVAEKLKVSLSLVNQRIAEWKQQHPNELVLLEESKPKPRPKGKQLLEPTLFLDQELDQKLAHYQYRDPSLLNQAVTDHLDTIKTQLNTLGFQIKGGRGSFSRRSINLKIYEKVQKISVKLDVPMSSLIKACLRLHFNK